MAIAEMVIVAALSLAAAEAVRTVVSMAEYLYNHLIFGSQPATVARSHDVAWVLYETDEQYIHASRDVLHEILSENPVEYLVEMDAEKRISAIQALTAGISEIYELEDVQIALECSDDVSVCGFYNRREHTITLNCAHLLTTNADLTKEFLDTVFHEFRHAVQWKMVESDGYKWYNDTKAVKQIADNFASEHYISYQENPRAYYYQYVERDAREIALYILEDQHA